MLGVKCFDTVNQSQHRTPALPCLRKCKEDKISLINKRRPLFLWKKRVSHVWYLRLAQISGASRSTKTFAAERCGRRTAAAQRRVAERSALSCHPEWSGVTYIMLPFQGERRFGTFFPKALPWAGIYMAFSHIVCRSHQRKPRFGGIAMPPNRHLPLNDSTILPIQNSKSKIQNSKSPLICQLKKSPKYEDL